jgi:hypothetical protein
MRKLVIGAVAAASLAGGSVAIATLGPLGIAGADGTSTTAAPPATAPPGTNQPNPPPAPPGNHGQKPGKGPRPGGPQILDDTLKDLVAKGTITQAQADAIEQALRDKAQSERPGPGGPGQNPPGRPGRGPHGPGFEVRKNLLDTAAKTIGVSTDDLVKEMRDGHKSIADVAKAHNVDPQKVIDAVVAAGNADIDAAVSSGKVPADKAADLKSKLADHVAKAVNQAHDGPGKPDDNDDKPGTGS